MFNTELGYRTLAEIDYEPESWYQERWLTTKAPGSNWRTLHMEDPITLCGAKMCFAGHAAVQAGWKLHRHSFADGQLVNPETGECRSIAEIATDELGLEDYNGDTLLFDALNDRRALGMGVDLYAMGASNNQVTVAIARYMMNEYPSCVSEYEGILEELKNVEVDTEAAYAAW